MVRKWSTVPISLSYTTPHRGCGLQRSHSHPALIAAHPPSVCRPTFSGVLVVDSRDTPTASGVSPLHVLVFGAAVGAALVAALAAGAFSLLRWRQLSRAAEVLQLTLSPHTPLQGVATDLKEVVAPCLLEGGIALRIELPPPDSGRKLHTPSKVHPEQPSSSSV
jgi:hypothetical protein